MVLRRLPLLALALLFALAAGAGRSDAWNEETGEIDLTATLERAPGGGEGEWLLVVKAHFGIPKLHVYAAGKGIAMEWRPIEAAGVAYDVSKASLTEPHPYVDPNVPEAEPESVWEGGFTLKVPIRVGLGATKATEVGASFDYSGCTDTGCYTRIKKHLARVSLGAAAPAATASGGGGETPKPPSPPPNLPAKPPSPAPPRPSPLQVSPPASDEGATASLKVDEAKGVAIVTFTPKLGYHLYQPGVKGGDTPIGVEPLDDEGIVWGEFAIEAGGGHITAPYAVRIPFKAREGAKRLRVRVTWGACTANNCLVPMPPTTLTASWEPAGDMTPVAAPVAPKIGSPGGPVAFVVIKDDNLGKYTAPPRGESQLREWLEEYGLLTLGILFFIGMGLAFTPCVLPIIPVTVSIISGGRADIPKRRLTLLLLTYVSALSLAFGSIGLAAAYGGASFSAAFESPAMQWGIAGLFTVLAFGMLGLFELQPPEWLMKIQGGAQRRAGSFVGAFLLGGLAAVIASPCTGPVIVGLIVYTAETGDALLGFLMFVSLGLGMGAVFFAAGSLNLVMRPGPWMVWVRYAFGVILVGAALYYLARAELISPTVLFVVGFAIGILSWIGILRHLVKKEAEAPGIAARRGAAVASMMVLMTGLVAFATRTEAAAQDTSALPAVGAEAGSSERDWILVRDVEHLRQEVAGAAARGQPTVVDFWATWCTYCRYYDGVIARDAGLTAGFKRLHRLKVDLTSGQEPFHGVRDAMDVPRNAQPFMVFFDSQGRIRRNADIVKWYGDESDEWLKARIDFLFEGAGAKASK
jgi:thiol:disulfide interchange protein DsbD